MRYIEVTVNTPAKEIDRRCEEMTAMGVGGFIIENDDGTTSEDDANTVTFTFTYTAVINGAETSFETTLSLFTGRGIKNSSN